MLRNYDLKWNIACRFKMHLSFLYVNLPVSTSRELYLTCCNDILLHDCDLELGRIKDSVLNRYYDFQLRLGK